MKWRKGRCAPLYSWFFQAPSPCSTSKESMSIAVSFPSITVRKKSALAIITYFKQCSVNAVNISPKQPGSGETGEGSPQVGLGVVHLRLKIDWSSKSLAANLARGETSAKIRIQMSGAAHDEDLPLPDSRGSEHPSRSHPRHLQEDKNFITIILPIIHNPTSSHWPVVRLRRSTDRSAASSSPTPPMM